MDRMIQHFMVFITLFGASVWACSPSYPLTNPQTIAGHPNCYNSGMRVPYPDSIIDTRRIYCYDSVKIQNGYNTPYGNIILEHATDSTVTYRQNALHELALLMESGEFWQVERGHSTESNEIFYLGYLVLVDSTNLGISYPSNIYPQLLDTTATESNSFANNYFLPFLRTLSGIYHSWTGSNLLHGVSYPTGVPNSSVVLSPSLSDSAAINGMLFLTGTEQSSFEYIDIATAKSIQRWSRGKSTFPAPFSYELNKLWLVALDPFYGYNSCFPGTSLIPEGERAILYLPDSLKVTPRSIALKISESMNKTNVNEEWGIWQGESITFLDFSFHKTVLDSVAALPTIPVAKAPFSKQNPITKWPEYTLGIHSKAPQNADPSHKPHQWFDLIGRRLP